MINLLVTNVRLPVFIGIRLRVAQKRVTQHAIPFLPHLQFCSRVASHVLCPAVGVPADAEMEKILSVENPELSLKIPGWTLLSPALFPYELSV